MIEKKRIYKFLIGLNKDLDEVRGRILGTKTLPRKVFSEVHREESRKEVMMGQQTGSQISPIDLESSALAFRGMPFNNRDNKQKKGQPWC